MQDFFPSFKGNNEPRIKINCLFNQRNKSFAKVKYGLHAIEKLN